MNKEELKSLITNKKGFPFYTDYWQQYFSRLSGEQCKEVLKLICNFALIGEQEVSQDFAVDMVANSIITNITRDALKREKRISASRENGKSGGRPKASKEAKAAEDTLEKPKKKRPSLEEVKAYCQERGNSVNPQKWFNHYESNGWKVGKNPMKNWKAAVRTWENSDYSKQEQPLEDKWSKY